MIGGWRRAAGACALLCAVVFGGDAEARSSDRVSVLEERVEEREAELSERARGLSEIGVSLERAQARVDEVRGRSAELAGQTRGLEEELAVQREAYARAKRDYEARAVAIYKGSGEEGLLLVLEGLLGTGEGLSSSTGAQAVEVLVGGQEDLDSYVDAREELANTLRQLSQKRDEYDAVRSEESERAGELRAREAELEATVRELRRSRDHAEETIRRIERLEAEERERIQRQRAATRAALEEDEAQREQAEEEAEIARDRITVEPVDLPVSTYMKLYKKAAADYGFASDWYVLAAIGQVESNHGENMGPSSAGAMGPMQFLPSTWQFAGVDGDGDGRANIMDPRDAIPAAALYLRNGGAPEDWYAALYSYNHADWYVQHVLAVAEEYRQADGNSRVPPYV